MAAFGEANDIAVSRIDDHAMRVTDAGAVSTSRSTSR